MLFILLFYSPVGQGQRRLSNPAGSPRASAVLSQSSVSEVEVFSKRAHAPWQEWRRMDSRRKQ